MKIEKIEQVVRILSIIATGLLAVLFLLGVIFNWEISNRLIAMALFVLFFGDFKDQLIYGK